jgi:hypothetical protein
LEQLSIVTVFEAAVPVGETAVDAAWENFVFLHIYQSQVLCRDAAFNTVD